MIESEAPAEPTITRRVFATWWIEIPATFAETFVVEDAYWHAYDDQRSVSLTSILVSDWKGPLGADRILRELPPLAGQGLDELPLGLVGRAATGPAVQPANASRVLSGVLAVDGRLLVATITGDDPIWARRVWRSIRSTDPRSG